MPSTQPGYLIPVEDPAADDALVDLLQPFLVGVTGLDGTLIRPRWQPNPANQPDFSTNWAAVGVVYEEPDDYAEQLSPDLEVTGEVGLRRQSLLHVQLSFYGPDCSKMGRRVHAGLQIDQNRTLLRSEGLALVNLGAPTHIPALVKNTWVPRIDVLMIVRQCLYHSFQVYSLKGLSTSYLDNEVYKTPLNLQPEP